jgi:hypothetical protein
VAEDGSSTRGVPGKGCFVGLVLLPLVLLRALLADYDPGDLHPTPTRLKLLQAATETRFGWARIYNEANEFWDAEGGKVTAAVSEQIQAGWLETGERVAGRIPVRPTPAGESILSKGRQR